jgi:endoglucanase
MKASSTAALFAALASSVSSSFVPAIQVLPAVRHEPTWERQLHQRADNTSTTDAWPYAPFNTKGRDIVNSKGEVVTWAGVNWPMSGKMVIS